MTEEMTPIGLKEGMKFNCNSQNECFNDCCRDLNQALTPYDVLRLKNNLGMSSQDFLKQYTSLHYGPVSGLPVIEFKPNPEAGYACPFVTLKGCLVYEDRPGSCRMYPLARAIARSRDTGEITQYFALIEEPHCKGFGKETGQTVEEWLQGQDVNKYNEHNDKLMEVIRHKNRILPGKLEGVLSDKFYLALYDIDEFRAQIVEKELLKGLDIPEDILTKIKIDDTVLLEFGIKWVNHMLFGHKMTFGE
ncbi:MAG: YkgJ family cysteine cluster protein [Proteobacteria bacterium]|nr:YkgJ family cysteine cluster protein [Pseudomonadota bacterium]MBU1581343.1 YkgJ family cysteine cluster protein [Pseudomonadota bacterium]MBU2454905.1 YkgJ family cysteine cluster protein [Pseudomonadota bacterium]MBU2630563.1 YkgJ family cysteine cluster protein [Pseudomonadota bacterium]